MADKELIKRLEKTALDTKRNLFHLGTMTQIHIGGDLSCCEIMTAIWMYAMKYDIKNPRWEGRDRFVLSKGHAAAVTSFSQAALGCYKVQEIFDEYATDNGRFGMHSCNLENKYVDVCTGSLGMGVQVATGIALALRLKGNTENRVYTVLGDGECAEGSVWEAAEYASAQNLGNLVAFIDWNGLCNDGTTDDIMPLRSLSEKFRAFGWNVIELADGNDMEQIIDAIDSLPEPASEIPTLVACHTVKGHGVDFMAGNPDWHYHILTKEQSEAGTKMVTDAFIEKWGE